jgi:hypothetical protein
MMNYRMLSLLALFGTVFQGCAHFHSQEVHPPETDPLKVHAADPAKVRVSAVVADTGFFNTSLYGQGSERLDALIVHAEVENLSSEPVEIWVMTCSWWECWVLDSEDGLEIADWPCNSNYPEPIILQPGGGRSFHMLVSANKPSERLSGKRFRAGFRFVATNSSLLIPEELFSNTPLVFSDSISIPPIKDHALAIPDSGWGGHP